MVARIVFHRCNIIAMLLLCISLQAQAQDTTYKVYFGLLHAHTLICDGSGTPEEAYKMAKSAGLDFFALTPHNHGEAESGAKERKDDVLIAYDHKLYNGTSNVTVTRKWKENGRYYSGQVSVKPLIRAAREATDKKFVALYGQEYSTISSSNHVNVLGIDHVIEVANGDFKGMINELDRIKQTGAFVPVMQLNHPNVSADLFHSTGGGDEEGGGHSFNDYGIDAGDLGPHFKDWVKAMAPYTHLIEVLSGPAMAKERAENYNYKDHENDYYFYLKQGLHVGPSAGQDNHYKTWGTVTDARTGIVALDLTEGTIYDAFRKHRTFVTEDKNMSVVLYVNKALMGASINATKGTELDIKVLIRDADEPHADYDVMIYSGEVMPEQSTAATHSKAADGMEMKVTVHGNGLHSIKGTTSSGTSSFYYVKVVQGKKDHAWTAPLWVNENKPGHAATSVTTSSAIHTATSAKYYWSASASSKVYHIASCADVSRIKPANLQSGSTPPAGRTQHHCK